MKILTNVQTDELDSRMKNALNKAVRVVRDKAMLVGFAESCTGGLLSSLMTKQSGISDIFWGSVVSYANESKSVFLGVQESVFKTFGAVSSECAKQMAEGLAAQIKKTTSKDVVTVAVTGIAGPTGGTTLKPVGTVFIAVAGTKIATQIFHHEFVNITKDKELTREEIQYAAAAAALDHLSENLK
ncbi:damage-inducible protein CinA [Bdellovibrio sp. qaytius]|nr:damage-inducible protein CinA [Bdellovibrio sp. qaytius]